MVPPAITMDLASSTTSLKWGAGLRRWYLISTELFPGFDFDGGPEIRVRDIRPSEIEKWINS